TDERDDDAPAWSAQREASLSFGKLFHRAMESCVLADASTFAPAVRAIDGALADVRVAEVVDAMKRALATPIGKRLAACAPDALGRELPYTIAREDGALVDGAIDAVLREGGAYVIVDYKTDRVAALKAAQRAEFHRPQLAAYADALERITGARPAEAHVIFARTGEAVRLW
ncbi:PD-(D/E)XK nuclease family protein, partial [bacterium]|nr:PD-(D/E)XK nuclease family protein [bacterium]